MAERGWTERRLTHRLLRRGREKGSSSTSETPTTKHSRKRKMHDRQCFNCNRPTKTPGHGLRRRTATAATRLLCSAVSHARRRCVRSLEIQSNDRTFVCRGPHSGLGMRGTRWWHRALPDVCSATSWVTSPRRRRAAVGRSGDAHGEPPVDSGRLRLRRPDQEFGQPSNVAVT